jgi:hypothetical protein
MIITQKQIKELRKLQNEQFEIAVIVSDKINQNKRAGGENLIEVERNNEKLQVREKILWEEVFHLGPDCQAGEILKKKYPDTFELAIKQNEGADMLHGFSIKNFGFDYTQMRLIDLIDLIEAIFRKNATGMFVILLVANIIISIIIANILK